MATKHKEFKNKIKDLQTEDFEHPEDFFSRAHELNESSAQPGTLYTDETPPSQRLTNADEMWIDASNEGYEGQLAIDVYQDDKFLYVKAIVGGVPPDDIEIHLNNDMLTIKGKRSQPDMGIDPENYYIQECYWGGFSRSVILPVDIQNEQVEAITENGVLTITLPKSNRPKNARIPIKEIK
ncbi:MAG: Hsp20/alpha crystallin family protein [bacterium]|nr:Hsp20/alpha crystallin family protein [bacterium]